MKRPVQEEKLRIALRLSLARIRGIKMRLRTIIAQKSTLRSCTKCYGLLFRYGPGVTVPALLIKIPMSILFSL